MEKKVAIYPGTFDPVTSGHLDVIQDASMIFDEVVVGLLTNVAKKPRFTEEKRKAMIEEAVADLGIVNVTVKTFGGLTVELARQEKAAAIIRGLRLTTEYEDELGIIFNNRILEPGIIHILIPPRQEHIHISSTVVRELLNFGHSDLDKYLPQAVLECLGLLEKKHRAKILESCQRLANKDNAAAAAALACDAIMARYQEPHRAYHTPRHINDCLNELETVRSKLYNPIAVELALLCHDAIYSAAAADNEEQSAKFAKEIAKMLGLPKSFGEQAAEMIMATKHSVPPPDFDTQTVADIDLASLGYSETEFDKNTAKVRREYTESGSVTPEQFNKGLTDFLKLLLPPNRPSVYLTHFFRNKYEEQARLNLERAIAQLSR